MHTKTGGTPSRTQTVTPKPQNPMNSFIKFSFNLFSCFHLSLAEIVVLLLSWCISWLVVPTVPIDKFFYSKFLSIFTYLSYLNLTLRVKMPRSSFLSSCVFISKPSIAFYSLSNFFVCCFIGSSISLMSSSETSSVARSLWRAKSIFCCFERSLLSSILVSIWLRKMFLMSSW